MDLTTVTAPIISRVTGSSSSRLATAERTKAMDSRLAMVATRAGTRAMDNSNLDTAETRVMGSNSLATDSSNLATASSSNLDTASSSLATAKTRARNTRNKDRDTKGRSRSRPSRIPAGTTLRTAATQTPVQEGNSLRDTADISPPRPSAKLDPGTPSTCRRTLTGARGATRINTDSSSEGLTRLAVRRLSSLYHSPVIILNAHLL